MLSRNFRIPEGLLALDYSSADEQCLRYLQFLQQYVRIDRLELMHVVKKSGFFEQLFGGDAERMRKIFPSASEQVERMKALAESYLGQTNIQLAYEVEDGQPLEELLEELEEQRTELLILGKKPLAEGAGVLSRNLARRSPSSLLFVPPLAKELKLERFMVPLDFSENSGLALQAACALARRLPQLPQIDCVHVYRMPDPHIYNINQTQAEFEKLLLDSTQEAYANFLDKYLPNDFQRPKLQLIQRQRLSTAGHLYDWAEDQQPDLIFLGAKGHTALKTLWLGSVSEKIIQLNEAFPCFIIR